MNCSLNKLFSIAKIWLPPRNWRSLINFMIPQDPTAFSLCVHICIALCVKLYTYLCIFSYKSNPNSPSNKSTTTTTITTSYSKWYFNFRVNDKGKLSFLEGFSSLSFISLRGQQNTQKNLEKGGKYCLKTALLTLEFWILILNAPILITISINLKRLLVTTVTVQLQDILNCCLLLLKANETIKKKKRVGIILFL